MISFIRKALQKPIAPKADLLAWYINTTTSRCLRTYDA
jgi:hypothetical protein